MARAVIDIQRLVGEKLMIGDEISVVILGVGQNGVEIGIKTNRRVDRAENNRAKEERKITTRSNERKNRCSR